MTKKTKVKSQVCQNILIRTVLKLPPRTHLDYWHLWLPVEKRVSQLKLGHIHQIIHGSAPAYMSYCFTPVSNAHSIGDSGASQTSLVVPRYRSLVGKGTFKYTGAIAWNILPLGVRSIMEKSSLKKAVKSHLLNNVRKEEPSLYV